MSLRPLVSAVLLGKSRRLSGTVDDPEARVSLFADAEPFAKERFVRRLRVGADGRFATRVRPTRGTRYRAVVGGSAPGRSSFVQVAVGLRPKLRIVQTGPTSGRATITFRAPGQRLERASGATVCLYQRPAGRKSWVRERCGKARRSGSTLVARVVFTDPSPQRSDRFIACTRREVAKGFITARIPGCGRKAIARIPRRVD